MAVLLGAVLSCSTPGKVRTLRESEAAASLRLPKEPSSLPEYMPVQPRRDTLKVRVRRVPFSVTSAALSKRNIPVDVLSVALPKSPPATALSSFIAPLG